MVAWQRPRHVASARSACLEIFALLPGNARIDDALERATEEVGEAAMSLLEIDLCARATDGGRLAEALAGRAAHSLAARDEHDRREVDRAARYVLIAATIPDPGELAHLRAATAMLRALALEDDLLLGLDAATARWWSPEELRALSPARPFSLDEHTQMVVEAVERRPGAGHLVRSRGLPKLARPDVAARVPRASAERVSDLLRDLAALLADGEPVHPGDRLNAPSLPPLTLIPRSDDCLHDAPAETAPLYELRDLVDDGAAPSLAKLLAAMTPRTRLRVI
jgi:hypothetical protein